MSCSNIPNWNLNEGNFKDQYGNERSWFDCGQFYFDGTFNVVKFPKGMSLYHGSPALVWYNAFAPLGPEYFQLNKSNKLTTEDRKILKENISTPAIKSVLERRQAISTGWYGNLTLAKQYSATGQVADPSSNEQIVCGNNCVAAFKLKSDAIFVNMYDPFNLKVLVESREIPGSIIDLIVSAQITGDNKNTDPDNIIRDLRKAVDKKINIDPTDESQHAFHPMRRYVGATRRITMRRQDLSDPYTLPNYLVGYFNGKGYAGYTNPETPYVDKSGVPTGKLRFGELVFGKSVLNYLKRDYLNKNDWQRSTISLAPETVRDLINDLSNYKTTNIDFHAGDLLEHSVWTAMYADRIYESDSSLKEWGEGIPKGDSMRRFIAVAAFLHDIGKAGDLEYIYYDKPAHPYTGADYLKGTRPYLYTVDGVKKTLDIKQLMSELQLPPGPYDRILICLVENHWKFGEYMSKLANDNAIAKAREFVDDIIGSLKNNGLHIIVEKKKELDIFFRIQILLSASDVLAAKPYNDHKNIRVLSSHVKSVTKGIKHDSNEYLQAVNKIPTVYINEVSEPLKYVSNRSQVHRGGDKYKDFKYDTVGIAFRKMILTLVDSTLVQ